jgi:hypothetical protein
VIECTNFPGCHRPATQYLMHSHPLIVGPIASCEGHRYFGVRHEFNAWTEIPESEYLTAVNEFIIAKVMLS